MINPHQIRPGSPISAAHVRSVATASMAGGLAQAARGLSSSRRGIVAAPASSARLANTGWSDAAKRERQASQLPRHPVGGIYTGGTPWFDEKTGQYVMPVPPWLLPPGGGAPGGGAPGVGKPRRPGMPGGEPERPWMPGPGQSERPWMPGPGQAVRRPLGRRG